MTIRERIAELENPVCCPGMDPIGIDEPCVLAIYDRPDRIAQLNRLLALVEAVETCEVRNGFDAVTMPPRKWEAIESALSALKENGDI